MLIYRFDDDINGDLNFPQDDTNEDLNLQQGGKGTGKRMTKKSDEIGEQDVPKVTTIQVQLLGHKLSPITDAKRGILSSIIKKDTILATNHDEDSNTVVNRVVIIVIDPSDYSHFAFDWAVKNFLRKETDLDVNVRPISRTPIPYAMGPKYPDFNEILITLDSQQRQENHTLLHEFASKLKAEKNAARFCE
ncbi:hypothetical protein Glove_33g11 [Diversispora epigaea]|uniref:Uncharacterized protein n=1 Tax=Diversispora epigaea TaxID=1348612 RepID=A0A397JRL9_9GLOM|nr:hypothetical protein Glove_33g11 [Diversispora epigaea]